MEIEYLEIRDEIPVPQVCVNVENSSSQRDFSDLGLWKAPSEDENYCN